MLIGHKVDEKLLCILNSPFGGRKELISFDLSGSANLVKAYRVMQYGHLHALPGRIPRSGVCVYHKIWDRASIRINAVKTTITSVSSIEEYACIDVRCRVAVRPHCLTTIWFHNGLSFSVHEDSPSWIRAIDVWSKNTIIYFPILKVMLPNILQTVVYVVNNGSIEFLIEVLEGLEMCHLLWQAWIPSHSICLFNMLHQKFSVWISQLW